MYIQIVVTALKHTQQIVVDAKYLRNSSRPEIKSLAEENEPQKPSYSQSVAGKNQTATQLSTLESTWKVIMKPLENYSIHYTIV